MRARVSFAFLLRRGFGTLVLFVVTGIMMKVVFISVLQMDAERSFIYYDVDSGVSSPNKVFSKYCGYSFKRLTEVFPKINLDGKRMTLK